MVVKPKLLFPSYRLALHRMRAKMENENALALNSLLSDKGDVSREEH